MFRKTLAAACAVVMMCGLVAPAYSHALPPPPPPPLPPAAPPAAPAPKVPPVHHAAPAGVFAAIACTAGVLVGAAIIAIRYGTEANGPGLCGIGMGPATCEDMRNGHYAPGPMGETPEMVKQQRLAEHHCLPPPRPVVYRTLVRRAPPRNPCAPLGHMDRTGHCVIGK